jgi:hypothetical protein
MNWLELKSVVPIGKFCDQPAKPKLRGRNYSVCARLLR